MAFKRTHVSRGPRRKTLWLDFAQVFMDRFSVGSATAVLQSSLNAAALALRPFTIVRTRGLLWVDFDQSVNTEQPFGALGFAVVSDQASAIGVTAVPIPITDAGSSLFFSWTPWSTGIRIGSNASIAYPPAAQVFDSKAMRKVEVGEDLIVTFENGSAADGMVGLWMARVLIKTN